MHFQSEGPVVVKVKDREAAGPPPGAGPAQCLQGTSSPLRSALPSHLLGNPWPQD